MRIQEPDTIARVKLLSNAHCYKAAFNELTVSQKNLSAAHAAWAIRLLCNAYDFSEAVRFFTKLDPKIRRHPSVIIECIYALGSASRHDDAQKYLAFFLRNGYERFVSSRKLVMVAPFATKKSLSILISYAILNYERFSDAKLVHFLYELAKRRGLDSAADTLLEIHDLKRIKGSGLEADHLFRSNLAFGIGDYRMQGNMVSKVFESYGLDGIKLKDETQPLSIANLHTVSQPKPVTEGPLVSVLVAAYNAADTIEVACQSLFEQTYRNIDVIIIDDGSNDGTPDIVRKLCEKESRARVLHLDKNYGIFTALNCGLSHSRGDLVTRHDADDWVHPERLRVLVSTMCERPNAIAAQTRLVRCSPHLGLESRHSGYARQDFPSLIYRRQKVRMELGFYDPVRVGGDAEFQKRLEHVFGEQNLLKLDTIAAVFRWSPETLTGGGEFAIRWSFRSPPRAEYRRSYLQWHEQELSGGDLFIPFSLKKRRFAAPLGVLGEDASHF